jgi:hypothetical protein
MRAFDPACRGDRDAGLRPSGYAADAIAMRNPDPESVISFGTRTFCYIPQRCISFSDWRREKVGESPHWQPSLQ